MENVLLLRITALHVEGAKGVKTINITPKTGDLIAIKVVENDHDLMIMNTSWAYHSHKCQCAAKNGQSYTGGTAYHAEKK